MNEIQHIIQIKIQKYFIYQFMTSLKDNPLDSSITPSTPLPSPQSSLLTKLVIGIGGIYCSYITAGLLNQRIIKKPYDFSDSHDEGQHFTSTLGLILFTTFIPYLIGESVNRATIPTGEQTRIPHLNSINCSLIILISTFSYISSIFYTSFSIATLFKSCNLLSVVLVGVCCSRVKEKQWGLERKKIVVAVLVTAGLVGFKLTDPEGSKGEDGEKGTEIKGIGLLIVSLIADGFLPDFQAEIKVKYKPRPMQMMTANNKWVCIFSFILLLLTNRLIYLFQFCLQHTSFLMHILLMGLLATTGQIFVYWMIKHFKQHIVPFVITTRKITTSGLSLLVYGHETSWGQVGSIVGILLVVGWEFAEEIRIKKDDRSSIGNGGKGYEKVQENESVEGRQEHMKKRNGVDEGYGEAHIHMQVTSVEGCSSHEKV